MEQVKIGWAKKEVSIDKPVSLAGQHHMRLSKGIHDPMYATALAVDGGAGQDAVIFISCDLISLRGIMDEVIKRACELDPTIPGDNIIMNATHTHTGGFVNPSRGETPDGRKAFPWDEYRAFYVAQAADAAVEAWQNRKPGGISYGYSYAVVGHSRRPVYFVDKGANNPASSNGHAVMYGKTNDPEFSHYEAGADHFVNVMITYDDKDAPTGFIINVPCPSQVSELGEEMSADYWNEVREMVTAEFGKDVFVLPQCAAAGDLSPRILHYKEAQARRIALKYDRPYQVKNKGNVRLPDWENCCMGERYDIAERILFAVKDVASWAKKDIQTQVKVDHVKTTVPLIPRLVTQAEKQHAEEVLATRKLEIPEDADEFTRNKLTTFHQSIINRNNRILGRFGEQDPSERIPMRMHVLRVGDIAFATNRFEYYQDYQHRIQARSPFLQTFVIQLAGEEGGTYLPTGRAIENKGYGSSIYENRIGAEGGQQIVDETIAILNEMKAKDEK
ncbi:MAG: hypothetical protein J6Z79_05950 [Clostridia bacterium]|nr:hypothetical protein [Clostridia bacterium]